MATTMIRGFWVLGIALMACLLLSAPSMAKSGSGKETSREDNTSGSADASRSAPSKSYAFYVGKNLTKDGSVLLAGSGEEVSGHWLEIVPRQKHKPDENIKVGVTGEASIPGKLTKIPQVRETNKYITMNYSDYEGFPTPLTNGGMNEYQVAMRDVWSPSREELIDKTPTPQSGPQYSDLARIAMERATTAREAVEIIGSLIEEYGYSTYGGNTHIVADPNEGWIIKEMAGGKGLWVAERLGPDEVRVSYPGYIGDIPSDYQSNPDYMGSDNLIPFAEKKGWYDPDSGKPFNVHEVYGDQDLPMRSGSKFMSQKRLEREVRGHAPLTVKEMMNTIGDPRFVDDESGYGQVAHLRDDLPNRDLATLWVSPTGSITAPFIPWRIGVQSVPAEYGKHRYLYKDSGSTFLDPDYETQEATEFAGRTFKRLMYYTCARPKKFLPEVTESFNAFEGNELSEQTKVEDTALTLYQAGKTDLARQYLTSYSNDQAMQGLKLGDGLLAGIEARTKVLYGIDEPKGDHINAGSFSASEETVNCLVGYDPDKPISEQPSNQQGGKQSTGSSSGNKSTAKMPNTGGFSLLWPASLTALLVGSGALGLVVRRRR